MFLPLRRDVVPPDAVGGTEKGGIMRAFVTGSTGLLGNNLVRILLNAGHEVWALARSKEKAQRELGDTAARVVLGDIRNVANFAYELRGIDAIFHTAAYFREYYNPGDHSNAIELTNVACAYTPRQCPSTTTKCQLHSWILA